jgi:hypothetical protein
MKRDLLPSADQARSALQQDVPEAATTTHYPALAATACGGLLFLLPVLSRLGIQAWCESADIGAAGFALRIFRLALLRMQVPHDDPVWLLVADASRDEPTELAGTPASWTDPLLAALRMARSPREALQVASIRDEQAAAWLFAARCWLRRGAHMGLASLVLRHARLNVTRVHIDVHFLVNDMDIRVRRSGLDIDPGWLPWFGRVVHFHYRERLE